MFYLKSVTALICMMFVLGCNSIKGTSDMKDDNQYKSGNQNRHEQRIQQQEVLIAKLMLTIEQEKKFRAVSEIYESQMHQARKSDNRDRNASRSIRDNMNKEIEAILTPEQYALYLSETKSNETHRPRRKSF